jgi:hypothetical protein
VQASSAATADDPTIDLSQLDVAAVMFDSAEPASFRQAVQLVVGLSGRAGDSLPFVLIAAKDDLGMSNVSDFWLQCASQPLVLIFSSIFSDAMLHVELVYLCSWWWASAGALATACRLCSLRQRTTKACQL